MSSPLVVFVMYGVVLVLVVMVVLIDFVCFTK
jgi:hypothetical protein